MSLTTAALLAAMAPAGASTSPDWPQYLNGPGHTSYAPSATSITTAAVQAGNPAAAALGAGAGNVQPVWRWVPPSASHGGLNALTASPTVVNGVIYIGDEDGNFYAISQVTHTTLWTRFLGVDAPKPNGLCGKPTSAAKGIISTAAVVPDPVTGNLTVYVFSQDGNMYALDAATGNVNWTSVVDTPSTTIDDYYSWSSPLVANGKLYIGVASWCDQPLVPAGLVSIDQHSGAQLAFWHSLPSGQIGASIWSGAAALSDGSIIATTGNQPGNAKAQGPYNDSIVRLDGSTLTLLDSWEVPLAQRIGDGDFGASPTVFAANLGGVSTTMVGACNKNGYFYAFNASNLAAGPVWSHLMTNVTGPLCLAAPIWNGSTLIESAGPATIGGTNYLGSVQALDPATGTAIWQTGVPDLVLGSPTENGSGVIAAQLYSGGVEMIDASNGSIIGELPTQGSTQFGQPVFSGPDVIVPGRAGTGLTGYENTTSGSPITNVSPPSVTHGAQTTITLTGSGFSGKPLIFVSGSSVGGVRTGHVVSPTALTFTFSSNAKAALGPRGITVIEPGSLPVAMTCTNCLAIS
jgi:outer membrane protein assembly factor BamB